MTKCRTFFGKIERPKNKCYSLGQNVIVEAHKRNAESQGRKTGCEKLWGIRDQGTQNPLRGLQGTHKVLSKMMMARTSNKCPRDSVKIRLGVGNNTLLTREQYNLEMHCLWMVSLGHFRLCSFTPFPHILLPLFSVVLCPGSHLNCQKFLCF